jgi:hypothetical protein
LRLWVTVLRKTWIFMLRSFPDRLTRGPLPGEALLTRSSGISGDYPHLLQKKLKFFTVS